MMEQFEDIRPYNDAEIADAMTRIANDPLLEHIRMGLFPDYATSDFEALFLSIQTVDEFQLKVMRPSVLRILGASSSSLSMEGFENLNHQTAYTFISNHRDIMLDSAILQLGLVDHKFRSTQITFGSNLMHPQITVDIGRSNKMFKVIRASNTRDFLIQSQILSQYIAHTIIDNHESIWIAQRNGRTKDGNDRTEQGLIKMLCLSDKSVDVWQRIQKLNVVPTVISYQWEPCDALKTQEIYRSRRGKYIKKEGEDLHSIITGIQQQKGDIAVRILPPLNNLCQTPTQIPPNESMRQIAELIDSQIHASYHLFNSNYLASDLLHNSTKYCDVHYDQNFKQLFIDRMNGLIDELEGDRDELIAIFLGIYARPVENKLTYPHIK